MASLSYENRKGSGKKLKVHFDLPKDEDYPNDHDNKHSSSSSSSQDSDDTNNDTESFEESSNVPYGSPVWSIQSGSVTHSPPLQMMNSNPNVGYDPNRIPSSVFGPKPTSPMEWSVASNESLFSLHLGNSSFSRDQFFAFNNKSSEFPKTNDLVPVSTSLTPVEEANHNNDENIKENEIDSSSSDSPRDSIDTLDESTHLNLENDHVRTSHENIDLVSKVDEHDETETLKNVEATMLDKTHDDHTKTSKNVEATMLDKTHDDHTKTSKNVEATMLDKTHDDHTKTSKNVEATMLDKTHDDHTKVDVTPSEDPKNYATSVSYHSVESDMSNRSFQFPILTAEGVRTSSGTTESEKQDKIEKQDHQEEQQQIETEKPVKPPSPKSGTTLKQSFRNWCCCSCFSCSPCF